MLILNLYHDHINFLDNSSSLSQLESSMKRTSETMLKLNEENNELSEKVMFLTRELNDVRKELANVGDIHYEETVRLS
jgi:hypothetical protein